MREMSTPDAGLLRWLADREKNYREPHAMTQRRLKDEKNYTRVDRRGVSVGFGTAGTDTGSQGACWN